MTLEQARHMESVSREAAIALRIAMAEHRLHSHNKHPPQLMSQALELLERQAIADAAVLKRIEILGM